MPMLRPALRDPNASAPGYQPVYAFEVKGTMRTIFRTVTLGRAQMITEVDYYNAFFDIFSSLN